MRAVVALASASEVMQSELSNIEFLGGGGPKRKGGGPRRKGVGPKKGR